MLRLTIIFFIIIRSTICVWLILCYFLFILGAINILLVIYIYLDKIVIDAAIRVPIDLKEEHLKTYEHSIMYVTQ